MGQVQQFILISYYTWWHKTAIKLYRICIKPQHFINMVTLIKTE